MGNYKGKAHHSVLTQLSVLRTLPNSFLGTSPSPGMPCSMLRMWLVLETRPSFGLVRQKFCFTLSLRFFSVKWLVSTWSLLKALHFTSCLEKEQDSGLLFCSRNELTACQGMFQMGTSALWTALVALQLCHPAILCLLYYCMSSAQNPNPKVRMGDPQTQNAILYPDLAQLNLLTIIYLKQKIHWSRQFWCSYKIVLL